MLILAVLSATLAALLAVRPVVRLPQQQPAVRRPALVAVMAPMLVLALAVLTPASLVLAATVGGAVAGAGLLFRRRARRQEGAATAGRVLEVCELLAGELSAGQPPGRALDRATRTWPAFAPVAETHALGGDVPAVLRDLATRPGAEDLRLLAAAWVVAHRTGAGLGDTVRRTAATLRRRRATGRLVEGELASARATARLVAVLPLVALLMGSGSGGDPWSFLLGTPAGLTCLVAGLACGFAGLWWIEMIADAAGRPG